MTSSHQPMTTQARRAIWGAFGGFTLDSFDIYLPLIALAPAIAYFTPASINAGTAALISSYIFVATLVGRPLGALIFGSLADVIGRRRSTIIAVTGFGIVTLLMGCLPGYDQWGLGAVGVLIALRFVGGVLLGGENTGANVLAMEEAPKPRRGLWGAVVQSGGAVAYILLGAITLLLLQLIPGGAVHSDYVEWGWRIPFFVGGLGALGFALYYARYVRESEVWQAGPKKTLSVVELFRGREFAGFAQVFVMTTGLWILLDTATALIPPVLIKTLHLSSKQSTVASMALWAGVTVLYLVGGVTSQRIGRRTYLMVASVVAMAVGIPTFRYLVDLHNPSFGLVVAIVVVIGAFVVCPWAVITAYLAERFKTANRSIGFGLGYSLGVVLPSFYATYLRWFSHLVPTRYAPLIFLAIGGFLTFVGAALGPETKNTDLAAVPTVTTEPTPVVAPSDPVTA